MGILHRKHPTQVDEDLINEVRNFVARLWDMGAKRIKINAEIFIGREQGAHGDAGVNNVFVVITCIIPAAGRRDNGAG